MVDEYIATYLRDVLNAAQDVETYFSQFPKRFDMFEGDIAKICVVERKVEIMGEAINRIRKIDPNFTIPNAREIIATRIRIIHGYDSVQPEFLWSLVVRHIPNLKKDILEIFKIHGLALYPPKDILS